MYSSVINHSLDSYILHIWYCSDATSHSRGQHSHLPVNIYASDQTKSFELRNSLENFCFFSSNSAIFEGFVEQLPLSSYLFKPIFLKGYITALNMENSPYHAPFNIIGQLISSLRKVINHKVEFHIQL